MPRPRLDRLHLDQGVVRLVEEGEQIEAAEHGEAAAALVEHRHGEHHGLPGHHVRPTRERLAQPRAAEVCARQIAAAECDAVQRAAGERDVTQVDLVEHDAPQPGPVERGEHHRPAGDAHVLEVAFADRQADEPRLMELDPPYCDVICDRYQRFTGQPAILERTGQSPIPMKPREETML